ncbi:MAG: tetratricopeptide repeat protein [Planctomycetaceae bacterium]|nr:tetratricopeptide repeat protein [Planctomycetaceae bacterium]
MSANLERGRRLLEVNRPAQAVEALRDALTQDPNDAETHALLSLAYQHLERSKEAVEAAETAIGIAPEYAYAHYLLAWSRQKCGQHEQAKRAIREALRILPNDADFYVCLAQIHCSQCDWRQAVDAASAGLAVDPGHAGCHSLRSVALLNLDRLREAERSADAAIAAAPNDAMAHAVRGRNALVRGDVADAEDAYREALRLAPTYEYARSGLVNTLIARNSISRWSAWACGVATLNPPSQREQIAAYALLSVVCLASFLSQKTVFIGSLIILLVLLRMMTILPLAWAQLYGPIGKALLRFDAVGRNVLTDDERREGNVCGACLAVAAVMWLLTLTFRTDAFGAPAVQATMLTITCAQIFARKSGLPRTIGWGIFAVLAGISAATLIGALLRIAPTTKPLAKGTVEYYLAFTFLYGWVVSIFTMQYLDRYARKE